VTLKNLNVYLALFLFLSPIGRAQESIDFSYFAVDYVSTERLASVDLSSHEKAEIFKDGFLAVFGEPANFAGKYYLYMTGCGTMCQALIAIDIESGRMVDMISASFGGCFQENSSLLITNPKLDSVFDDEVPDWAQSYYYKFSEEGFELLLESKSSFPGECINGQ
jgi:hypothetical protein